jgi:hypothetical protein
MPKFDENVPFDAGEGIQYSGTKLDRLFESKYTLCNITVDTTGSVYGFEDDLKKAVETAINALKLNKNVCNNVLARVTSFNSSITGYVEEVHGFTVVKDIDPDNDYQPFACNGLTPLFFAHNEGVMALFDYGVNLYDKEFDVNTLQITITDGEDNIGGVAPEDTATRIKKLEKVESHLSILITIDAASCMSALEDFNKRAEFDHMINVEDSSPEELAKIADIISSSVEEQSTALGSGKSANLNF